MATVDPPFGSDGSGQNGARIDERLALTRPAIKSAGGALDPLMLASEVTERLKHLHEGDHLIAARELQSCFSVQVPANAKQLGAFKVLCPAVAKPHDQYCYNGTTQAKLDKEVSAMKADPGRGEEIQDQERQPDVLFLAVLGLHKTRAGVATRHVSAAAHTVAQAVSHMAKRLAKVPRPDDGIWTTPRRPLLTRMPLNGSLPGGHALVYTALAEVLAEISRGTKKVSPYRTSLRALAKRMAENRERALVHTSTDTQVGTVAGVWLAERLLDLATMQNTPCEKWAEMVQLARKEWV